MRYLSLDTMKTHQVEHTGTTMTSRSSVVPLGVQDMCGCKIKAGSKRDHTYECRQRVEDELGGPLMKVVSVLNVQKAAEHDRECNVLAGNIATDVEVQEKSELLIRGRRRARTAAGPWKHM